MNKVGRREYVLSKMIEYGFWPRDLPTPLERQLNETPEHFQERTRTVEEHQQIVRQISDLNLDIDRLQQKLMQTREAYKKTYIPLGTIKKLVAKEIMAESKRRRAERKAQREQLVKQRSDAWKKKMAEEILFIGRGYSSFLNDRVCNEAKLKAKQLPVITDGPGLAKFLGISFTQLRFLCYHRDVMTKDHYARYSIPKRKGGMRAIAAPMPLLKHIQREILDNVLVKIPSSKFAHGFIPAKSVITNASVHVTPQAGTANQDPALVINMDLKDFFPTISFERVRGMFKGLGYSGHIASLLAMICTDCDREKIPVDSGTKYVATEHRKLPQGSPASPMITNVVCQRMDKRLNGLATKFGFSFTRYADDMTFSRASADDVNIGRFCLWVKKIAEAEGFKVNEEKTRFMRKHQRQEITGVTINRGKMGIPKVWIKRCRAAIYNATKMAKSRGKIPAEILNEVRGMAAWVSSVAPGRYQKLLDQAKALFSTQQPAKQPKAPEKRIKVPGGYLQGTNVIITTPPPPPPTFAPPAIKTQGGFSIKGMAIYITGVVPGYTKDTLEEFVKKHGGIWKSFGKNLDLLVIGDKPGPDKLQKALEFGIKTISAKDFFAKIENKPELAKRLSVAPQGKYRVILVKIDVPIKTLVTEQGLTFKPGRGFYEFTKPETISKDKIILLMKKDTGEILEGDTAREVAGLPKSGEGKVDPASLPEYRVFIQSTSSNRVLKGGTTFLYETD